MRIKFAKVLYTNTYGTISTKTLEISLKFYFPNYHHTKVDAGLGTHHELKGKESMFL